MNEINDLFSQTGDGACTIDDTQRIVSWNQAATDLLGYSRSEAVGRFGWQLLAGQTAEGEPFCQHMCPLRRSLQAGEAISSVDLLLRHRSGSRILVNVSTVPMPAAVNDGKPGMLVHLWRPLVKPALQKRLRIYLLGATAVTRPDGTMVKGGMWNRLKVRALLACLALHGEQAVSRDYLLEMLWSHLDYKAALHNLNTTVYSLRRSLEPKLKKVSGSSYIAYQNGQYYLVDANHHWLDVHTFEANIHQARAATRLTDKIDAYRMAVALYRGDYLADLQMSGWQAISEQAHYQMLYLAAMEELGQAYEALQKNEEAQRWYERVLAVDPCRESAAHSLVTLLWRQGRRSDALAICQQLSETMAAELDASLCAEMRALLAEIRLAA